MLDLKHSIRNLILIIASLWLLPINTYVIIGCYIYSFLVEPVYKERTLNRIKLGQNKCTVLVTGVGMTKGLTLARIFYRAGHRVIGGDFEPNGALSPGRFSKAIEAFYRLEQPTSNSEEYAQKLLEIVVNAKVDLWVSCSGVASAVEDALAKELIERKTSCKAIQFGLKLTKTLHEKHTFIDYVKRVTNLAVPETHTIRSHHAAEQILSTAPTDRKYIMKPIGMVDTVRGDMTLLPKECKEDTIQHLAKLPISEDFPWIVQEFIEGNEYCTHAVIANGKVQAFVACPSSELLMHYESIPKNSDLANAMFAFTTAIAETGGSNLNGHMSFDFLVPKDTVRLLPIECNPRAHTAVVLFNNSTKLADACLLAMQRKTEVTYARDPSDDDNIVSGGTDKYYWVGHDLVALVVLPTISFLIGKVSQRELLTGYKTIYAHVSTWKDGTFEIWDPIPFWILYHVYWPVQFWHCLTTGRKWSRINVSTLKMFEC